jgi:hypothetical protein
MAELEVKNLKEAQEKLDELLKLDPSMNRPSESEIEAAHKEFEEAAKAFSVKLFEIGSEENFGRYSTFVLEFLEKFVYWTKNGWMGVLKLNDEVHETRKTYKSGPFTVGYQALEFLFYVLTNPGGSGIESAREIEKHAEVYAELIENTGKALEAARAELKDIQWLEEKRNAMMQGFYLEKEDGVEIPDDTNDEQLSRELE